MSEKTYVTIKEGQRMDLGVGNQQCFEHESSQPKTMPVYTLVKAYGKLSEYDKVVTLEVLKFLYQFTFATRDQLRRMLEIKGVDPVGLDENIGRMLELRQMNSFYLDRFQVTGEAPEDAFVMYCIDFGALALLDHFSNCDCNTWFTSDSCRSSELLQKYVSTTEFYLALAEVQGTGLRYFKPIYDISYDHRSIRFSAVFQIGQGIGGHTFLMESVRDYELPLAWQKKLDEKLVPFASNAKHWHRYFEQEPIYLMLVENNDSALEAAILFYNRVEKTNFRLITDTEVLKGLDNAKFLKFAPGDRAEDGTPVTPGKLQATRIPLLSGGGSASQN